jgi:hypothetical protein
MIGGRVDRAGRGDETEQAVDGSVLRPPRRLARPGSRLGDRGSRVVIGLPTFTTVAGTVDV